MGVNLFQYKTSLTIVVFRCNGCPEVLGALAVGEVVEVCDHGEAVVSELLILALDEAERHLTDERCPAAVGAPRPEDAVAKRQRV